MKKNIFIFLFILIASVCTYLFLKPAFYKLSDYLSKSNSVNANTLVVEGWLPEYAIEMAYQEFQNNNYKIIVTTGQVSDIDYFEMFSNGRLNFYPGNRFVNNTEISQHVLEVEAYSELAGNDRAHFNFYVNDSLVGNFYAEKHNRRYSISWYGSLSEVDSVCIQFDNDKWSEHGDRNLFVKEIVIDRKVTIPYQYNSEYHFSDRHKMKRIVNNLDSYADIARSELIAMGIDSSLIIAVPCKKVIFNRTLTSALAFRDWVNFSKFKVEGINIVSEGTHARRTWMAYNKLLHKSTPIGIISLPDYEASNSRKYKLLKTFREAIEIGYYWLILKFY